MFIMTNIIENGIWKKKLEIEVLFYLQNVYHFWSTIYLKLKKNSYSTTSLPRVCLIISSKNFSLLEQIVEDD